MALLLSVTASLSVSTPALRGRSRFFLDTADASEWSALLPLGVFHGVTTNPVLLQRAGVPCTVAACHALASTAFDRMHPRHHAWLRPTTTEA